MVLPETSLDEALRICEEIRRAVESTVFLSREWGFSMPPLHLAGILSASIGIACYVPDPNVTTPVELEKGELLRRADAAMYRAKSLGKNQAVVWDESLLQGASSAISDPVTSAPPE